MTREQELKVRALSKCRMGKHNTGIDFISRLRTSLCRRKNVTLSPGQCYFLDGLVHRYRNQLVRLLPTELQLSEPPQEADYVGGAPTVRDLFSGEDTPPKNRESGMRNIHPQRSLL